MNGLDGVNQLVVPDSLRDEVLHGVHEGVGGGHLGVEKTVAKLKEHFYWPDHYSNVQNWCATYGGYVARKTAQPHQRGGMQSITVGYPFRCWLWILWAPFLKLLMETPTC